MQKGIGGSRKSIDAARSVVYGGGNMRRNPGRPALVLPDENEMNYIWGINLSLQCSRA